MLEKLQSQPAPDQLPDLNEGSDTDNEFVKQYLEQRQKVFAAQMEARRRLEGMLAWFFMWGILIQWCSDGFLPRVYSIWLMMFYSEK